MAVMKKNCLSLVLIWWLIFAHAGQATAWNSTGHMAVALLAWRQLDGAQRQAACQLLRAHPHYKRYLTEKRPEGFSEDEWVFLRAATWPDWVRGTPEHHDQDLKPFHHAEWHYINLPYAAGGGEARPANLAAGPNVVNALNGAFEALVARRSPAEQQAIELCWVLHLAGDIHQPLHCATLISPQYPPPHGDDGGNRLAITPHKRPESLHTYWDSLLGRNTHFRALDELARRVNATAANDGDLANRLDTHNTVRSWADESYAAAVEFAYLNGQLPLVDYRAVERGEIPHSEVPILPSGYGEAARDVARRQAALAGWRLAAMLKQITAAK